MTDPYNSHGSNIQPPAQPSLSTTTKVKVDLIGRLNVSDSWKDKFRLIDKAGGPDLPNFRDLSFNERFGLNFNILAFIFGPFYYLAKGLWRQAVLFLVIAISLAVVLEVFGLGKLTRGVGYGFAAIYGMRANISYYKKMLRDEIPWF